MIERLIPTVGRLNGTSPPPSTASTRRYPRGFTKLSFRYWKSCVLVWKLKPASAAGREVLRLKSSNQSDVSDGLWLASHSFSARSAAGATAVATFVAPGDGCVSFQA